MPTYLLEIVIERAVSQGARRLQLAAYSFCSYATRYALGDIPNLVEPLSPKDDVKPPEK